MKKSPPNRSSPALNTKRHSRQQPPSRPSSFWRRSLLTVSSTRKSWRCFRASAAPQSLRSETLPTRRFLPESVRCGGWMLGSSAIPAKSRPDRGNCSLSRDVAKGTQKNFTIPGLCEKPPCGAGGQKRKLYLDHLVERSEGRSRRVGIGEDKGEDMEELRKVLHARKAGQIGAGRTGDSRWDTETPLTFPFPGSAPTERGRAERGAANHLTVTKPPQIFPEAERRSAA
jgi:hypothetical protein